MPTITDPITGLAVEATLDNGEYAYGYGVDGHTLKLKLPASYTGWSSDRYFAANRHLIAGYLLNGRGVPYDLAGYTSLSLAQVQSWGSNGAAPRTARDRYDYQLLRMMLLTSYDGQVISQVDSASFTHPLYYQKLYARHPQEVNFYGHSMADDGLIYGEFGSSNADFTAYRFRMEGLQYMDTLKASGKPGNWGLSKFFDS